MKVELEETIIDRGRYRIHVANGSVGPVDEYSCVGCKEKSKSLLFMMKHIEKCKFQKTDFQPKIN